MAVQLELVDPRADGVEAIWRDLARTARPPYFLTWGWIESWLALLPADARPVLALVRERGAITGAFFLGRRHLLRHGWLPSRALFVNETGVARYDELTIEHNGVLGANVPLATLVAALPDDWDELFLPAVDRDRLGDLDVPGYHVQVDTEIASPFVDLAAVRAAGDYLALLSANTRAQIRRARRRAGRCELDVARTVGEAFAIYDELVALHAATWRARGQPGAFADPWFDRFHRRLIEQRFEHGEIQLVRLRARDATVGCLYNLVAGDRIAFYQSGLAPPRDAAAKPGLLAHAAAIEHGAANGFGVYDFLGGNAQYKAQLATAATRLVWLRVQRAHLRFAIEDRLREWKHAFARQSPRGSIP